ncbi:hypothetical protein LINGRAHAP2_LOCUS33984 [Linum grandiflorum]
MEFFTKTKAVKLRSHLDKYILADDDGYTVRQTRTSASSPSATWYVELAEGDHQNDVVIRLRSSFGTYLTASDAPFLLGAAGFKVVQTSVTGGFLAASDHRQEWRPVRDGFQVRLRSWCGKYLRGWRNAVVHDDGPCGGGGRRWMLWDVEAVVAGESEAAAGCLSPDDYVSCLGFDSDGSVENVSDDYGKESPAGVGNGSPLSEVHVAAVKAPRLTIVKSWSPRLTDSPKKSTDSNVGSPPKTEGRTIYYHVADESGDVDDDMEEGYSMSFKGNGVEELTEKLKEETGLSEMIVCSRSPLNGKLYPLRLQLPPNNADMHVIVVPSSSKVGRDL